MTYKVGDKVTYYTGNSRSPGTNYKEPGIVTKVDGSLVTVQTEDSGKVIVHSGNSNISRDWIEKERN